MKIMITCCAFILDNTSNNNIRKNDLKSIKVLVDDEKKLINIPFLSKSNIKDLIRDRLSNIFKKDIYHLEQVYTLAEKKYCYNDEINIIYIIVTNRENLKDDLENYNLLDFNILNNDTIVFDEKKIKYHTKQRVSSGSLEYIHEIETKDLLLEKDLLQLLISYKYIRSRIDNTDILFKFVPSKFTLEDIRQVYEMIANNKIDKSNFRKKIIKYCEPVDEKINNKGYRPTQVYKYKSNFDDLWI